jgi:hypothetical protein
MGQLVDSGCIVTFDAEKVIVRYNNLEILTGTRTPATMLWELILTPVHPQLMHQANGAIGSASPEQLVAFAHAALFPPALSTLDQALAKGYITNFPGLTSKLLRKYPPRSIPMVKGHLKQSRQNQRSTKPKLKPKKLPNDPQEIAITDDHFPKSDSPNIKTHSCYSAIINSTGQVHSDQTGQFPIPSSAGNKYMLVVYCYDSNAILVEPMRTRTSASIVAAYTVAHTRLCKAGFRPQFQRLDNECSEEFKTLLRNEGIDFQLVPPGCHRRNAAERAIQTFKDHLIAGLCSVDKGFPMHLWDKLLVQSEITLNLLRGSRTQPHLSAYAALNGLFDFNRTPIAPPGIRVLAHEKTADRTSYSPSALDGWYVGPARDSYRCYDIWIWETRTTRICDTVSWFPTKIKMPLASSNDLILAGIKDILHALNHPSPESSLAPLTDSHVDTLRQLSTVLTNIVEPPSIPPVPLRVPSLVPILAKTVPAAPTIVNTGDQLPIPHRPSSLRVPTPGTMSTTKRVRFSPLPPPHVTNTFSNITGPTGTRRRKTKRTRQRQPVPTKTVHPTKLRHNQRSNNKRQQPRATVTQPKSRKQTTKPVPRLQHQHGTRANSKKPLNHVANAASKLFSDTDPESPTFAHAALHGNAFNPDTGKLAEFLELSKCSQGALWQQSNDDEIGRLAQGHGKIKGTNTLFFIPRSKVPKGRTITYLRVVCAHRPEKENPFRVRWTVGGNLIEYPGDVSTKTAGLIDAKLLFNSVISTPNAKFMTGDLKDFYLGTPMERFEYMRIPVHMLSATIIKEYNLTPMIENGFVYVEIRRGMYGLPQAGKIANDQLIKFMKPHGYAPVPLTHGLWKHNKRDIVFTLVVDDFGVKYTSRTDAEHLITTLEKYYKVSTDWEGTRYCGLTLAWDYLNRTCDVSMPGYIERALQRFQHPKPAFHEAAPHPCAPIQYGAKTQWVIDPLDAPALDVSDTKRIQEVLGTLLYYARAVDSTMLVAIGDLATQQTSGTKTTMERLNQLLNYAASNPNATIRFTASDMILAIESDASYLSVTKARSRASGYFFLTNQRKTTKDSCKSNG